MPKKIVLASNNPGKLREIQAVLGEERYQLIQQSEFNVSEVAETIARVKSTNNVARPYTVSVKRRR